MTKGLSKHFTSPQKPRDKKKRCMAIPVPGNGSKQQKLLNELKDLLAPQPLDPKLPSITVDQAGSPIHKLEDPLDTPPMELDDVSFTIDLRMNHVLSPQSVFTSSAPLLGQFLCLPAGICLYQPSLTLSSSTWQQCSANHY